MTTLQTLLRYKSWANMRLFATLAGVPAERLAAPQPIVFGSMLRTLHHVLAMDGVWKAHLQERPHGLDTRNPPDCPQFAELRDAQRAMDAWFENYAATLSDGNGDELVRFTFIGGGDGAMTRGEILLHVVNHATYHRGHIADMMYRTGVTPPTTDLPVFLRERDLQAVG